MTSFHPIGFTSRSRPSKLAPSLGPCCPGARFRYFHRCLHRKETQMANPSTELEMTSTGNYPPGSIEAMLVDHLKRSLHDPSYFNEKWRLGLEIGAIHFSQVR